MIESKSETALRTISEVAAQLGVEPHVLRFWESRIEQIQPMKHTGRRRFYRPDDVALLAGIRHLLHERGLTIKGVQKILRDNGVPYVRDIGQAGVATAPAGEPAPIGEGLPPAQKQALREAREKLTEAHSLLREHTSEKH